ncbi:hypothetical protein POX_b03447 [Penicillium oxalicum]|uniref:hypothetical protein n=1 Tax=Penicillium oxalicum TaxID=69781 RepID=UPI0020B75357|nr:hypothetical protein POX_b03447 [Penicillium oxalicum]KAI2793392.1 hypothetical protein POX_b03447 [Penicillium oxalicum]
MEPALIQLARPIPPLRQNARTANPSVHSDRLSLARMSEWRSFSEDALRAFHEAGITHEVPFQDETELYTVGTKHGVSGRFVRNLCDPVMRALAPLPGMESIRFADFPALSTSDDILPDICLGRIAADPTPDNVYLVGEIKTRWTIPEAYLHLNRPSASFRLEPLMGQLVVQMRMCSVRFGFLSTYNSTVFVKRAADSSFLLSPPVSNDAIQPSLRQLFAGFCRMAQMAPRSPGQLHPQSSKNEPVTSSSVIVDTGTSLGTVINCIRQLSDTTENSKATWLASMNETPVILKCWRPSHDELFDAESEVYERLWSWQTSGHDSIFARWILRGEIICSSIFPSGYALVLEHIDGVRLDRVWHTLAVEERASIESRCRMGIRALRQVNIRLDNAGMHNVLYSRENDEVTLVDFESAQEVTSDSAIPPYYEMEDIFGSHSHR